MPIACAVAGVTLRTRKLPLPSYYRTINSYAPWLVRAIDNDVCDAPEPGHRMWPPVVLLTCTVKLLLLSVAKPIDQPLGSVFVEGRVTVNPALLL